MPLAIAGMRNVHNQCPKEVLAFVMDLFKYSDNQLNKVGLYQLVCVCVAAC